MDSGLQSSGSRKHKDGCIAWGAPCMAIHPVTILLSFMSMSQTRIMDGIGDRPGGAQGESTQR